MTSHRTCKERVKLELWPLIQHPPRVCTRTGAETQTEKFSLGNCWSEAPLPPPPIILGEGRGTPLSLNQVRETLQGNHLKSFNCASLSLKSLRTGNRNRTNQVGRWWEYKASLGASCTSVSSSTRVGAACLEPSQIPPRRPEGVATRWPGAEEEIVGSSEEARYLASNCGNLLEYFKKGVFPQNSLKHSLKERVRNRTLSLWRLPWWVLSVPIE